MAPTWARRRPSKILGWTAAAAVSALWATLRLVIFSTVVFPLTYVLPLLLCVWTRDKVMLWTMAAVYAVAQTAKQFFILPAEALPTWADWSTYGSTLFNIAVGGAVVHAIIVLRDRMEHALEEVEAQSEELARQNEELAQQAEALAAQNEETTRQSEELTQQTEELSQQSEELAGQNEEMQAQSEEIHALNTELGQREALLQNLLDVVRLAGTEASALQQVCAAALEMVGPPAMVVVVHEAVGEQLVVSGRAAASEARQADVAGEAPFARLVIEQDRPACLNDTSLRPDLGPFRRLDGSTFGSVLGAPLEAEGRAFGALVIYGGERHEWTAHQFRLAEWLAGQASHILHTVRLGAILARQAALIDLTPDAIIVRGLDGTITLWGHGAEILYGWTKEEAIGRCTHDLLRTQFPRPLPEIMAQLEQTGRWTGELRHTTRDGRERVVESRWLARRDASGLMTELLESNVDVSDRKRAEQALRDADQRKDEFLATLSHELRNPLAPIRHALQLLESQPGAVASEPKRVIERQLAHLVRLVDDLLDATRIASNKIRLRTERVELGAVIEQAVEACRPDIEKARHSLAVSVSPSPIWLEADPDRIAQVLINLLSNAARYTPPGGRISLSWEATETDVDISVKDNGMGLDAADLSRVFEMFAQIGEPGHGGLGIGLALVKRLVELHGGQVEARSDGRGRGCDFHVRLSRAGAPLGGPPPAEVQSVEAPKAARRILVVDDNVDAAQMMKELLQLDGHEVEVAHDARSALSRLNSDRFDVGLFDIGLPGMSGYELAEHVRRTPGTEHMYLIAVTGWGQQADRDRARASGFDAHLTKPAEPDVLMALVSDAVLARAQARRTVLAADAGPHQQAAE